MYIPSQGVRIPSRKSSGRDGMSKASALGQGLEKAGRVDLLERRREEPRGVPGEQVVAPGELCRGAQDAVLEVRLVRLEGVVDDRSRKVDGNEHAPQLAYYKLEEFSQMRTLTPSVTIHTPPPNQTPICRTRVPPDTKGCSYTRSGRRPKASCCFSLPSSVARLISASSPTQSFSALPSMASACR